MKISEGFLFGIFRHCEEAFSANEAIFPAIKNKYLSIISIIVLGYFVRIIMLNLFQHLSCY